MFKRVLSLVLSLCIIASLLPPMQFASAAEVTQRYELDTDGIDVGATYLIVSTGSEGSGNALRFYYDGYWSRDLQNQALTVEQDDGVTYVDTGFTNEADCQFQFSAAATGNITHGQYSLNLSDSNYVSGNPENTLTFTNVGGGQYRIHYTYWWRTYYLRYNNSDWTNSTTSSSVYLYKLTEHIEGYDVIFDGNGYTAGTLPENATMLSSGEPFEIPEPPVALRKDVGEDTWLFLCWNTLPDGSGVDYNPGDVITITEDLTLYAKWYEQAKYTISMITYLDGVATDVNEIAGYDREFYAVLDGDDTYIPLTRSAEGTYTAKVAENGSYVVYAKTEDDGMEAVHGHKIVVYNGDGSTECMHYSVSYDAAGGAWAEGNAPGKQFYHANESVVAYEEPTMENNRFLGWKDQDGKVYAAGQLVTGNVNQKITLTAVWEKLVTVTVNVTIDHKALGGGEDNAGKMHEAVLTLLREENGVNLPVEERILTEGYTYDEEAHITTYQVVFGGMQKGVYHAASTKTDYESTVAYEVDGEGNHTIAINLKYTPDNFDLTFDVVVNADTEAEKQLMPQAVNVKVSYWGYDENEVLGWHIITQQAGDNVPTTVTIDENGRGSGFFPVWRYWSSRALVYEYRVEVTSFVMPDGTIVPAAGDKVTYRPNGSGLYEAIVSIADEGEEITYPDGSVADLPGAYIAGEQQVGIPTVTIEINPMTVTFEAGEGKVNGQQTIVLENQYREPALQDYVAVPNDTECSFVCWTDENGKPVDINGNALLTGDVTYYARYSGKFTLHGNVWVDIKYEQDGQDVLINEIDRAKTPVVVLQKKVGDVYNDVASCVATLSYNEEYGVDMGTYEFANLPNDGSEYRIQVLTLNFNSVYNNNNDQTFAVEEAIVPVDAETVIAQVDAHLDFAPESYQQALKVNASQIHQDLRPTDVVAQILYRDLGDVHAYNVISQHTKPPYGVEIQLNGADATGMSIDDVWMRHTNGTPYEYQLQIAKVFGNVEGVYEPEGTDYQENPYYTVVYGAANNYLKQEQEGGVMLEATLVPKKYAVRMDLNLGDDPDTTVVGLEQYMVDDGRGGEEYAFVHTWSYDEQFTAYPYREGYVFEGWLVDGVFIKDGVVQVRAALANNITITAQWKKLENTDYTILYLEQNTEKVLRGATVVSGVAMGEKVVAAEEAVAISGYAYAGAVVDGTYISKIYNPTMTVTNDPTRNLLVIYYLPDGSDGYTEQVESNLEINKDVVLEGNGTYTITLDTYTKNNPITTLIQQDTPLDIVLVLDQSASIVQGGYLDELKSAVDSFVDLVAKHGRSNEVDHRVAVVGYAGNENSQAFANTITYPIAGGDAKEWVNTGVFDSNGDFHPIKVTGFNYTPYTGAVDKKGTYYTYSDGEYLLLTYHDSYYHLVTAEEARVATLDGTTVYGYVDGLFVPLSRNSSDLWLYGDRQLYSGDEFFIYYEEVWTHRSGTDRRLIHGYTEDGTYKPADNHQGLYVREETREANPQLDVYKDALVPVSVGANGSGGVNPGLFNAISHLGSNGQTYVQYGIEMANRVFAANPLEGKNADRIRIMVMFTDGMPGSGTFDEEAANAAIAQAYETKNTHDAYVYTVGLYSSDGVDATDDEGYFMNGVSSNYPNAKTLDDVRTTVSYSQAPDGYYLSSGGPYYVNVDGTYYELSSKVVYQSKKYWYSWGYDGASGRVEIYQTTDSGLMHPMISGGKVGDYVIWKKAGGGYQATPYSGYYSTTDSEGLLQQYFAAIVQEITTKITTNIILHEDTILRDIMGQGLVLTPGTVVTAYKELGRLQDGQVVWTGEREFVASATIPENAPDKVNSTQVTTMSYTLDSGKEVVKTNVPYIQIYNLNSKNATNPDAPDYHPHTVDITGYDFEDWYIGNGHTEGYKMIVTITRVEARDDVRWGAGMATNHARSGLWLPEDENQERELLLAFEQPTTIFVERAYVLDYGKEFTLSGWYFDDEDGKNATPVHLDCDITDGMNWFDTGKPNTSNVIGGEYGNTKYGNVRLEDGNVKYAPTSMNWGGYDQFYVFGQTWRRTVLAQDANKNGVPEDVGLANLWNKVTVIPANNIYYEDSFITTPDTTQNGIEGFTFDELWTVVGTDSGNTEIPEHLESAPYGDVHGWTDSLKDDQTYTDGSAHVTGLNGERGAKAEFTFTGTGVEVYTRTNNASGMVVAELYRNVKGANGVVSSQLYHTEFTNNLAESGGEIGYYHIPTVSFSGLPYGTYTLKLTATSAYDPETQQKRYVYYIDGVRVYNPLGNTTDYLADTVKTAYGLETNAVFTEVRDILLSYEDFNTEIKDGTDGKMGAVFIDQIKPGQESGNDSAGVGVYTYEIGTFRDYGPKNEVYMSPGQAIVLKVEEGNTYYVGMKSLTGEEVIANVSGIDREEPEAIRLSHTTDMYYRVTPVNGYIVIQNGNTDGGILSVTTLRTTNLTKVAQNGGVLQIKGQEAVALLDGLAEALEEKRLRDEAAQQPGESTEEIPSAQQQTQENLQMAAELFTSVRQWIEE